MEKPKLLQKCENSSETEHIFWELSRKTQLTTNLFSQQQLAGPSQMHPGPRTVSTVLSLASLMANRSRQQLPLYDNNVWYIVQCHAYSCETVPIKVPGGDSTVISWLQHAVLAHQQHPEQHLNSRLRRMIS